ncbi:nuclear transport factor 2 family protein [Sphingomicrobium sediminis]|uniref:Nuclear transport factor 2 family protein n=1 Tax=Sphingomicrobium sediminis TaxID=2950949 RepID=A0A9X2ELX1_9SPHN|nr:nuclear transport factor 2 family protein [Sphingomicrobium sediminis]MCM8557774.1 nuclear transport factor 2 family protein [Sphingomicrobium sediminis]
MLTILAALLAAQPAPDPMPTGNDLTAAVAEADSALFWAAFEGCDPAALGDLLTEDFRMVHDVAGLSVASRADFVAGMEQNCAGRAESGYMNRRLLTPGSRRVQALGDWGALEEGHHQFYELQADGSWVMTGGARYIHVWQWTADGLKLTESISVDHGAAPAYPPAD